MPFYRKRVPYEDLTPFIQRFLEFLRANCSVVQEAGEGDQEVFFIDEDRSEAFSREYRKLLSPILITNVVYHTPYDRNHALMYVDSIRTGPTATVSATHVRLPGLAHLITLTPKDFFSLLQLIATAKNTSLKDSLSLDPAAAGLESIEHSTLAQFFTKLRVNYRMNADFCDKKWTSRDVISSVAFKTPTRENQLAVMQYFTAIQNSDVTHFPIETVIDLDLGLNWLQITEHYCIPKRD